MDVVVTTGAIRRAKLQSNRPHQQSVFFTGCCPSCCPTNSVRALKEKFFELHCHYKIPTGIAEWGHYVCTRRWQSVQFSTEIAVYLGNGMSGNRGSLIA